MRFIFTEQFASGINISNNLLFSIYLFLYVSNILELFLRLSKSQENIFDPLIP
jgi:hypothetical protein